MRYKVPQNIDMQDRILGPLTMLQFVYAVVGGGLAYVCYMSIPNMFGLFLAIMVALFTLALIFLKINERPFLHFLASLFVFMGKPRMRVWQREESGFDVEVYKNPEKESATHVESKHITREQMERMAKSLDSSNNNIATR